MFNSNIMKTFVKLLVTAQVLIICSCGTNPRVYTSGSYGTLKSYKEKPHYNGEKQSAFYLSADYNSGKHTQHTGPNDDTKTISSFLVHRSITDKHYNFYYGLGGYFGKYIFTDEFEDLIINDESKKFYGVNLTTGTNYTLSTSWIDLRLLGLELGYNYEFGPLQNKLAELRSANNPGLISINKKSMFSYNFYSEYVLKFSNNDALSFGVFFGDLLFQDNEYSNAINAKFNGFTVSLRIDRFIISAVKQQGNGGIESTKIGFTYKL